MIRLRTFAPFAAALLICAILGPGDSPAAPRAAVRLVDPVSQPLNRKAFEARVNELSAFADAIDGGSSAAPRTKVGIATIAAGAPTSAWVELWRFVPGASKRGAVRVHIVGNSAGVAPSVVRVDDRFEWSTTGAGVVLIQGYPGHSESIGDPGCPATPDAPGASVATNYIDLSWAAVSGATGYEVLYSVDAGSTYRLALPRPTRGDTSFRFSGNAASMSAIKFKLRAYNDVGFSFDSLVTDATTGATHSAQHPCINPTTNYTDFACLRAALAPVIVPNLGVSWDDRREYLQGNYAGDNTGGVQVSCAKDPTATTALLCRARTYNTRTATLYYAFDSTPH